MRSFDAGRALLLAVCLATIRMGLFWLSLELFTYSDSRQVVGYFIMMVSALPDVVAAGLLVSRAEAPRLAFVLIALSSAAAASVFVWIRARRPVTPKRTR